MGKYVVIEGIDTVGKSTQIELLKRHYNNAIFTKEPSDSEFGKMIRDLALHKNLSNLTQTMLFLADRANHTQNTIKPHSNSLIISDRSFISGVAYADSLDFDLALQINCKVAILPHLVVILETNEKILDSRLKQKQNDNIESRGISYLLAVQSRIIKATEALNIKNIRILCDKSKDEILATIIKAIDSL